MDYYIVGARYQDDTNSIEVTTNEHIAQELCHELVHNSRVLTSNLAPIKISTNADPKVLRILGHKYMTDTKDGMLSSKAFSMLHLD